MKRIIVLLVCLLAAVLLTAFACYAKKELETGNQQDLFSNGIFRITDSGRYVFAGKYEGQILIETDRDDVVELVLEGLTLHNPNGPAIFAPRSRRVELILADGTTNTISDGRHPNDDTNAVIYIQHDLIISGNGTLNVKGDFHHGIRAQDYLIVRGGIINVTAVGDALRGRDGVIIENGTFTLTAGGDGIQSNNNSNPERGFITINGGIFAIKAGDDGLQAETNLTINGGDFTISAVDDGMTTKGPVLITGGTIRVTESYEGIEGLNITITGGDISVFAKDDGINAREHRGNTSMRGRFMMRGAVNDNVFIRFAGGNIHVVVPDGDTDGIDSNGHIFLEGGTLHLSGPSRIMAGAIDSDGAFVVTGGELITAGSIESIDANSTQPIFHTAFNSQYPSGSVIEAKDVSGRTLLEHTAGIAFSMAGFTSQHFSVGETYSIYINNEKVQDITLNSIVTNQVSGRGFGGPGGFGGGGRMQRGSGF